MNNDNGITGMYVRSNTNAPLFLTVPDYLWPILPAFPVLTNDYTRSNHFVLSMNKIKTVTQDGLGRFIGIGTFR